MGRDLADSETERGGGVRRGATRGAGRVGPREGSFQRLRRPAAQPALRGAVNRDLGSPGLAGTGAGGDRSGAGAADVAGSRLTPHPHPSTWGGGAPRFLLQPAAAKRDRPRLVFNCCHHLPDLQEGPPAAAGALEHLPTRLPAPPPGWNVPPRLGCREPENLGPRAGQTRQQIYLLCSPISAPSGQVFALAARGSCGFCYDNWGRGSAAAGSTSPAPVTCCEPPFPHL